MRNTGLLRNNGSKWKHYRRMALFMLFLICFSVFAYAFYVNVTVTWIVTYPEIVIDLDNPESGTVLDVNTSEFNWTGSGGCDDPLSYVFYVDTENTFSSCFLRVIDVEYNDSYTPGVFMDGRYYWRVEATDGLDSNVSFTWNFTVLTNDSNSFPYLQGMGLDPTTGYESESFVFTVNYTDADNNTAGFVNVTVDGTNYSMSETDPSDIDTSDGKQYSYTLSGMGAGEYNYSFSCSDSIAINSTGNYTDMVVLVNSHPNITNPSPSNNSLDVDVSQSSVSVLINDSDGHSFNWSIETCPDVGNSSGNNENNGTKTCSISGLNYSETYYWYVNVSDGYNSTNESFVFHTVTSPYFFVTDVYPGNNSVGVPLQPDIYATFNHNNGSSFNITWYYGINRGDENTEFGNNSNVDNGTFNQLLIYASNHSTYYYWRVMLDDGNHFFNETFVFMTDSDISFVGGGSDVGIVGVVGVIGILGMVVTLVGVNRKKNNVRKYGSYDRNYYGRY